MSVVWKRSNCRSSHWSAVTPGLYCPPCTLISDALLLKQMSKKQTGFVLLLKRNKSSRGYNHFNLNTTEYDSPTKPELDILSLVQFSHGFSHLIIYCHNNLECLTFCHLHFIYSGFYLTFCHLHFIYSGFYLTFCHLHFIDSDC